MIRRMSQENYTWGASRIHGELAKLGIRVSQTTVAKYMMPRSERRGPTWRTFIRLHLPSDLAGSDPRDATFYETLDRHRVDDTAAIEIREPTAPDKDRPSWNTPSMKPSTERTLRQRLLLGLDAIPTTKSTRRIPTIIRTAGAKRWGASGPSCSLISRGPTQLGPRLFDGRVLVAIMKKLY